MIAEKYTPANYNDYEEYLRESPFPVGYVQPNEQQFLFQNLLIGGYNPNIHSILDIGAGRGDLYGYIKDSYSVSEVSYLGLEQSPVLVDAGIKKYENIALKASTFPKTQCQNADWVVACGVMFEKIVDDVSTKSYFLDEFIPSMYDKSNLAVSFNLVNQNTLTEEHENFIGFDPGAIMNTLIAKYRFVTLRHNYSDSIFTVTIYKL